MVSEPVPETRGAAQETRPEGSGTASRVGARDVPLRLRLGRARRRQGPGTPTPSWKLEDQGAEEGVAAASAARRSSASASARQLGASLWEIHDVAREARRSSRRGGRGIAAGRDHGEGGYGEVDQSSGGIDRHLAVSKHRKLQQERSHRIQPFSRASYTSSVGDSNINQTISPTHPLSIMGRSIGEGYSLKTSTELLKVLNRIWSLEEQHTANLSVVHGLKLDLQQAQTQIQELMRERRQYRNEVSLLMRQLSENKLVRKDKEDGKFDMALHSLQVELEDERRLRKHSEDLHRKLGKELSEIKSAFLKAVKDLEKEKKGNRLLEDLCDQFANGIRNYEEELRVVKQRNVKNYELNFDRSVLHISEVWLDERMQMQNGINGKSAYETTITERLSSEIHAFLLSKRTSSSKNNEKHMNDSTRLRRQSLESVHLNGATSAPQLAEEDDDDDSVASYLHCFELNMHDHARPHRSGTGTIDVLKRRSENFHSTAAEGSYMSSLPVYSQEDISRSSSCKLQRASKVVVPEMNSQSKAKTTPAKEQNGTTSAQITRGSHHGSSKSNLDAHHVDCLGQESFDHFSRTSLFCEVTTSGDLGNLGSPTPQVKYQSTSLDPEISECPPEQPVGVVENTLKAKLLQARLEGRQARLNSSGGSSNNRRK